MTSESIGNAFRSHSDVDFVEVEENYVTVMFNMGVTPEEAKQSVESIVYKTHNLTLKKDVRINILPDSVKMDDDDLNSLQHAIIIEVL